MQRQNQWLARKRYQQRHLEIFADLPTNQIGKSKERPHLSSYPSVQRVVQQKVRQERTDNRTSRRHDATPELKWIEHLATNQEVPSSTLGGLSIASEASIDSQPNP